ncbi:Conserved_hypothetical protein [Hexamita inflata]|uniref:Transmembrane protein n=1 Tax=Hexamita inflata TaxID=28002 RepID=A0AA86N4J4_9EUKA|nr:Conserved hypothetical protein [Hexamita inflata]
MLYLINTISDVAQQTFKTCFSPRSYLRGNTLTNELTLHLIPFDHIEQINDYNQCKTALDKMNVQAYLHFDDISFPRPADPKIYFKYEFNTPIDVVFPVSDVDYNYILDKPTAVFELRYDISYVIVNGSVSIVEHTKYNGTGCFATIAMMYEMYDGIDILANPNNCQVDFAANIAVSFDYTMSGTNKQLPIYACTSNCVEGEYNATTVNFQDIKLYRVKKTDAIASKLMDFYTAFVANRLIKMSLNLRFVTNGVQSTITQFINNKTAKDTLGCVANDLRTPTYYGLTLYALLNPNGLVFQIRDSLINKMNCDIGNTSQVKLDHYMKEGVKVDRRQLTTPIDKYNEQIGLQLESDDAYQEFRKIVTVNTYSLIVISFQDSNGLIIYELCTYYQSFLGCFTKQALHIYQDKQCLRVTFDPLPLCRVQYLTTTNRNSISLYYQEGFVNKPVGQYNLQIAMNYSDTYQEMCYTCDQFDLTQSYVSNTCQQNQKLFQQKLTNSKILLVYTSSYEQILSDYIITEYQTGIWTPLIITAVLLLLLIIIAVALIYKNSMK